MFEALRMKAGGGHEASLWILAMVGVIGMVAIGGVMMVGEDSEAVNPGEIGYQFTVGELIYEVTGEGEVEVADTVDEELVVAEIPSTVTYGTITPESFNVTSIGEFAFQDCENLISIIIPDSVTSIGYYGFYHCMSLTSVIIPDGVKSIGGFAFSVCFDLSSITIPNGIEIGYSAFNSCESLTSITIPDDVEIGYSAFDSCESLTSVTILDGVSIGDYAFRYCESLVTVIFKGDSLKLIGLESFDTGTDLQVYTPGWDPTEVMTSDVIGSGTTVTWANPPAYPDLTFLSTPSSGLISYIGRSAA